MRKIKPKQDEYMVGGGVGPLKQGKSKPIYPTISLGLEHIPEAKNWKVGKTYRIELELKMTGISQGRYRNEAEFEVHGIEPESDADEEKEGEEVDETGTNESDDDHE